MKTNKKIKNLICYICTFALALVANLTFYKLERPNFEVYAAGKNTLPISLSNANFNSNTSSTYPFKPDSYTATSSNTNIEAGVINIENTTYANKFENLSSVNTGDNYVLMIDADNITTTYGYTTNSSIKLSKGGTYLISVDVYTANGGKAQLTLTENEKEFSSINNIISNSKWTPHYFFVKTNDVEDVNVTLGMYLSNSSGAVLFDNIRAQQINETELNSYINNQSNRCR
jgi:hypothetical protein